MARELSFTEFMEFILARLYDLDRTGRSGEYMDIKAIAAELKEPVPRMWPSDAMKALRDKGLVEGVLAGAGTVEAFINGHGRLYVEERERQEGLIHEYREEPSNFVFVSRHRSPDCCRYAGGRSAVVDCRRGSSRSLEAARSDRRQARTRRDSRSRRKGNSASGRAGRSRTAGTPRAK